jgi:predicted PurR-regulated permease PerM
MIGLVLAYVLLPVVKKLDRWLPRWASITAVYLIGFVVFDVILVFVIPSVTNQISEFIDNVPDWFRQGNQFVNDRVDQFQRSASPEVQEQVNQQLQNIQATLQRNASAYAQSIATFLLNSVIGIFETIAFLFGFLIIPFFLFYILIDTDKLPRAIDTLLHARIRADFWNIWNIIDGVLGRYIRGQLLLALSIGAASFVGLTALNLFGFNIGYTLLLALLAAFGELIPVVGPILSAIPALLVALGGGTSTLIAVLILYVLIQQLENQILVPRIVGNTLKLHAALLMALLVIAGAVGGLFLVILSAPLAAIGRDIFIYLHRRLRHSPQTPERAIEGSRAEEPTATKAAVAPSTTSQVDVSEQT